VASGPRIVGFLVGFGAATGLLLALLPQPAAAQILDRPPEQESTPARKPLPDASSVFTETDPNPFYDGRWGADVHTATPPQQAVVAPGPWDTQTDVEQPFDAAGERAARVLQDGDPVAVVEQLIPADGLINLDRPNELVDAELPAAVDTRAPADIAAFSAFPGFDPLLLQAEEINPVFAAGWGGLFDEELPFAPVGTRIGSFILFSEVEANGDYNSNLFASPEALGDYSLEIRPAGRLVSDWDNHAVELRASGDLSFHDKYPSEDDRAYLVEGLGRLDVTRRTNLQGAIGHEEAQESRSAINASSAGSRPNITVNRGRGAFNHEFNRLSVQLRGGIVDTSYGTDILAGVPQSNSDRDYTLYEQAARAMWEFMPTFALFTDVAINQRDYGIAAFSDGINRSSTGQRYRVGVSFGDTGAYLRGDVSLGYGRQTPDAHQLEVIDGLLFDANLSWRITQLTTLGLTSSTEVAETTTAGSGGVLERQYAAEVRHNFTARLVGIAGVTFYTRDFVGAGLNENQFTAATGLEYFMNRHAVLFARYEHTAFDTSSPNGNWTGEVVQLGVRVRN
jgi:hypothetical protein